MIKVEDLYYEIADGLDFSGEITSIDVKYDIENKPECITIRSSCPNYPEIEFYQITVPNNYKEIQPNTNSTNDNLRELARYEMLTDAKLTE